MGVLFKVIDVFNEGTHPYLSIHFIIDWNALVPAVTHQMANCVTSANDHIFCSVALADICRWTYYDGATGLV